MVVEYRVRSGDSLNAIANFHNMTLQEILDINPQIDDPDVLFAGQVIAVQKVAEEGPSIHAEMARGEGPIWYKIATREMETGIDEIVGADRHNPRIVEYHKTTTLEAMDDETPWCSSFVNWCMKKAGETRTESAAARSWLKWGKQLDAPRLGCVVVFSRPPKPTSGHVAFFAKKDRDRILVLGGNQSNQVNISSYPESKLLEYRWPSEN